MEKDQNNLDGRNIGKRNNTVTLSPEQIVEWLEGHRKFMFEIWGCNPELRRDWEMINK